MSVSSVSSRGRLGNGASLGPALSADGRFVAFESLASNLVEADKNSSRDVFVHDRLSRDTTRVSVGPGGVQGNATSFARRSARTAASSRSLSAPQGRENVVGLGFKGPAWFTRTTNGGDSWEPARIIYATGPNNQTIGSQIVVLPAAVGGDVLNFFNETLTRPGFRIFLSFVRSTNRGATWDRSATRVSQVVPMDRVREDGVIDTAPVPCPDPTDQGACPIRTGDILFDVAVDRGNGRLYAVWQDARFSGFRYDTIAFSQSTNGGQSWSAPVRINPGSDAGARVDDRQAFTPAVHVADDGTVGVTFYDFRNNTAADGILATDQFAVHCHASCTQTASWAETRVTQTSFDMRRAPFAGGYFVGDYEGLGFIADDGDAIAPGDAFASLFSQSHGADQASAFLSRLAP